MEKRNAFVATAVFPLSHLEGLLNSAGEAETMEDMRLLIAEAKEKLSALKMLHRAAQEELLASMGEQ